MYFDEFFSVLYLERRRALQSSGVHPTRARIESTVLCFNFQVLLFLRALSQCTHCDTLKIVKRAKIMTYFFRRLLFIISTSRRSSSRANQRPPNGKWNCTLLLNRPAFLRFSLQSDQSLPIPSSPVSSVSNPLGQSGTASKST